MRFIGLFGLAVLFLAASAEVSFSQSTLVSRSDIWRFHKGTNAPQSDWKTVADASLNADWASGPGGFGYGDNDDATILTDMMGRYVTVFIRRTFNVASTIDPNLVLRLVVDYDDAYVAYLDGVEIARSANIVNGSVGVEPAFTNRASSTHEASAPVTIDLGSGATRLAPGDHTLALIGLNDNAGSSDLSLIPDLLLVDPGACPANTICTDTNWTAAASPYLVNSTLTINSGATLSIEPGVTVRFGPGAGLRVNGRLLAEGTAQSPITFTRSGASGTWSQIYFAASSQTSRVAHAVMRYFANSALEAHDTTLHVDSVVWTNSTAQVVDLFDSSIILLNSFIPGGAGNEPVHFNGMPANGHALIKNCVFGAPQGYNDSIDFTGGNRPGPIAQFIDNVFLGGVDDCFDMDGTDAHIEGNIFINVRKDASRDSSSNPITTGADGGNRSELVICRNIFYNGEHAFMEKDFGTGLLQNNTIVRITPNPLSNNPGEAPGIIMFGEPWRGFPFGSGAIFEGNIAADLQVADPWPLLAEAQAAVAGFFFTRSFNCVQGFPVQPGVSNINSDPLFVGTNGITAGNIRQMFALQAGSPCVGTGPNGIDMGALVPSGASISGVPSSPTTNTSATLTVAGPGIWAYRWRLDGGPWSSDVSLVPQSAWNGQPFTANMFASAAPINLANLSEGTHTIEVIGRNSAGAWQDTNASTTRTWTVAASVPLRIEFGNRVGNVVTLSFIAQAGQTYTVLYRDAFDDTHPWIELTDLPAQGTTGPSVIVDSNATSATRFYQIVTPAQ